MSTQLGQSQELSQEGAFGRASDSLAPLTTTRTTGKLLATQGYVVGIEISGSGTRQSVAIADLEGKILHRVRRPLEYVPDTGTVLDFFFNIPAATNTHTLSRIDAFRTL